MFSLSEEQLIENISHINKQLLKSENKTLQEINSLKKLALKFSKQLKERQRKKPKNLIDCITEDMPFLNKK